MTIYFDMDGTIADLYGVEGWLEMLRAENPKPYKVAEPLVDMRLLARVLHTLQREGVRIGIISWLSKSGSPTYNEKVEEIKRKWLKTHLKSVNFDEIHILAYGTPKTSVITDKSVLFDDEAYNRYEWRQSKNTAYNVTDIIATLKNILAKN